MSHFVVPDWHLNHQRQEQLLQGEESNRSSHVHKQLQNNPTAQLVPMSDYDIAELTWENGQLAMHGLGGGLNSGQTKPTWGRTCETLESIVHQATKTHNENPNLRQEQHQTLPNIGSIVPDSEGKWVSTTTTTSSEHDTRMGPLLMKKRTPPDSEYCPRGSSSSSSSFKDEQQLVNRSASATTICRDSTDHNDIETSMRTWASFQSPRSFTDKTTAKGSVNFCRDNDTTVMTWSSYQSPQSLKTISTDDHQDSACQEGSVQQQKFKNENQDDDRETKTDHMVRSHSTSRRSRAAAIHNQSERKRRDRINQKMKALQKLVPGANKTDKASILDEVIKHLKQLQAQIQMMTARNIPQMMMPMGTQQQLQMSLLQRMGMGVGLGMGMGMLDMSTMAPSPLQSLPHLIHSTQPVAASNPAFVSPPFLVPQMIAALSSTRTNPDAASMPPLADPYCAFLAQQMNMELYNKMAALHQQQVNQSTQATRGPSQPNHHLQAD